MKPTSSTSAPAYLIYGLFDPESLELRYIGQTRVALKKRLDGHCGSKQKTHTASWIKGLQAQGLRPEIRQLAEATSLAEADQMEQVFIACLKAFGCPLTNHHDGGQGKRIVSQGTRKNTPEAKQRMSEAAKARYQREREQGGIPKRPPMSAETRQKMSEAAKVNNRGRIPSPETRAKMSIAGRGRVLSAETRARMSVSKKALAAARPSRKAAPETCAKIAAANKGKVRTPAMRERYSAARRAVVARKRAAAAQQQDKAP